jgi:hypothetical protein
MDDLLKKLNSFLGRAALTTYAGGGPNVDPDEPGFKELEYREGDWHYKDSYTGFFRSWGREVVWYQDKPVWNQLYGGGMQPGYCDDTKFARDTFDFLKKALSDGEKVEDFQPRGPKKYEDGDWSYICKWKGSIEKFEGHEEIAYKSKTVFTHDFFGGLAIAKDWPGKK